MQELFSQNENINSISDYLNNTNSNVCLLEGKAGSFKTYCVNEALKASSEIYNDEYLTFKLKCYESTTLDDIFLLFLDTIKNYAKTKKLAFAKVETNDIAQRINHYLSHIKVPSIVIIDSLQNVFNNKNEKDKDEILRFIDHLSTLKNYKLVLVSNLFPKSFEKKFLTNGSAVSKISMIPLSQKEVDDYFLKEHNEFNKEDLKRLYDLTQGNPAELFIVSTILSTIGVKLSVLFEEYLTKQLPFNIYLIQKILTFVPDKAKLSLQCLSVFNGGLSEEFLVKNNLFTTEQIDYLLDKDLLYKEYGLVFVKSYIKHYLDKTLSNYDKNEYHSYWKNFYSSQLPLKPIQRDVLISRNTMRAQIEYHTAHILQQNKKNNSPNLSLMSYLNSDITSWNYQMTNTENSEKEKKKRPEPPESLRNKSKPKNLEKYELTKNEMALLGVDVDLSKNATEKKRELSRTPEQRGETVSSPQNPKNSDLESTFELAVSMENVHNYETAATFFLQALEMNFSTNFETYQPQILNRLAHCCEKMNRTSDAIDFYNKLVELYFQKKDTENVNGTKIKIAQIYQKTYKFNKAKVIYEKFIAGTDNKVSTGILLKAYSGLADIEAVTGNIDAALVHYEKAFSLDTEQDDEIKSNLSNSYFNYAMLLDEANETQKALTYYKKCIEASQEQNTNVSTSYTNIAEILKDEGDFEAAIENYKKAMETDTELSNYEGMYYIALKLAIMYEGDDDTQTQYWLLKSLSAAKQTKDSLYISNSYIEAGDFYASINGWEKALKSYLNAKKVNETSTNDFDKEETLYQINKKITKTEKHLSSDVYSKIVSEMTNE